MAMPDLSIVIPTYNEEKNIEHTLFDIKHYLSSKELKTEILVVDDGSKDQTTAVIERLQPLFPTLKLHKNTINRGKGYVIRKGMLQATGRYVLFMDADNATKISELENFFPEIKNGCQVVIGSRRIKQAKVHIEQSPKRKFLGILYIHMAHWILGIQYGDYNCGFKLFKREIIRPIFEKLLMNDWSFDAEIFLLAKKLNIQFKEVPVNWKHGAGSKVSPLRDGIKSFFALLKIKSNDIFGKYKI